MKMCRKGAPGREHGACKDHPAPGWERCGVFKNLKGGCWGRRGGRRKAGRAAARKVLGMGRKWTYSKGSPWKEGLQERMEAGRSDCGGDVGMGGGA